MKYVYILLYALIAPLSYSIESHKNWIHNDIQEQPQTYDYKVISVKHLIKKRSINELSIKVKLNGTDKEFVLQCARGYFAGKDTRVWEAEIIGDNFKYTLKEGIMEKVNISFYQDEKTKSVVSHTVNKRGISEFNGIINSNVIIHPISHLIRKRRDAKPYSEYENDNINNYHVIYKRDISSFYDHDDNNEESNEITEDLNLETPDIVYPEILVFVDITLYERFQMDIEKTVAYTLTLFNGADLTYRVMKKPLVRFNIAGIVLCRNQPVPNKPYHIFPNVSTLFSKFMYNEHQFKMGKDYDIAVLMGSNPDFTSGVAGYATVGGACLKSNDEKEIYSTAIMLDDTLFSGINIAAHELGHLFGSPHDGDSAKRNSNLPGAEACPEDEGYLMSTRADAKNQYHFSSCSKKVMSHFFSQETAKCLLNNPAEHRNDEQMLRILPGKLLPIDEQCRRLGYAKAGEINPSICSGIKCIAHNNTLYTNTQWALEGTPCDLNKFCLRGECADVPFNETKANLGPNILFPPFYHLPGINKSAEEQCRERGHKDFTEAYFKGCTCYCQTTYPSGEYIYYPNKAQDGTLCNNTGYCRYGECVIESPDLTPTIDELTTTISSEDVTIPSNEVPIDDSIKNPDDEEEPENVKSSDDYTTTTTTSIEITIPSNKVPIDDSIINSDDKEEPENVTSSDDYTTTTTTSNEITIPSNEVPIDDSIINPDDKEEPENVTSSDDYTTTTTTSNEIIIPSNEVPIDDSINNPDNVEEPENVTSFDDYTTTTTTSNEIIIPPNEVPFDDSINNPDDEEEPENVTSSDVHSDYADFDTTNATTNDITIPLNEVPIDDSINDTDDEEEPENVTSSDDDSDYADFDTRNTTINDITSNEVPIDDSNNNTDDDEDPENVTSFNDFTTTSTNSNDIIIPSNEVPVDESNNNSDGKDEPIINIRFDDPSTTTATSAISTTTSDTANTTMSTQNDTISLDNKLDVMTPEFRIENQHCRNAGRLKFFAFTDKECVFACVNENDTIFNYLENYDSFNSNETTNLLTDLKYTEVLAQDGYECGNNKYCQAGKCDNKADSGSTLSSTKSADNSNQDDLLISYQEKLQSLGDMYVWTDEVCKNFGASGALEVAPIDCVLQCKTLLLNVNDFNHRNTLQVKNYTTQAPNNFPCRNNGSCFDGKCVVHSNDSVKGNLLNTTSNNVPNSNDSPPSVDSVTPALDETNSEDVTSSTDANNTTLASSDVATNSDTSTISTTTISSSDYITIFSSSTTPHNLINNSDNITELDRTTPINVDNTETSTSHGIISFDDTSDVEPVDNKFENEHCKTVGPLEFYAFTNDDCVFACKNRTDTTSNKMDYLDSYYEFTGELPDYVSVSAPDGYNCGNNGYCLGGQCVERTDNDSNTSSTDFTNSMKESTTPESVENSSHFNSSSSDGVTSSLNTTPSVLITNDDSSDNNTIFNVINDFKESTTPESILDSNNVTTPQSDTIFDAPKPVGQELQIMNEQCERAQEGYFFTLLPNKCFIGCILDKYMAYHPDKDNDTTYQAIRDNYIFFQEYKEVVVQDGFKCTNNKYCLGGQCVERTTTDSNTSSTDFTKTVEESTTPKGVENSTDFSSSSSDSNTNSLDSTTHRDLITNDDSSDYNTISNDIDDFEESTTPESILDVNEVTTPQNGTTSDAPKPVDQELQILNEQCEQANEGYFFILLPNKCFIACTLDKYLAYHPDKENDDNYQTIREITMFLEEYKEVVIHDGFKCKDNGYCLSGQCVERTITDSNTSSTDFTDSVKESTTPKRFDNSSDFNSSSSDGVTSSLNTTPRVLITNDDSSKNNTISNDIDDFKESTTPGSILDVNDVTTPQSGTTSGTSDPVDKELQIMNEQCERAKEGYFFGLLPNKCFIACTLDKYLAYHPDKDNDDTYQAIRNDYVFFQDYKEIVVQDGFKCKDNGYCQSGQCVEKTDSDTLDKMAPPSLESDDFNTNVDSDTISSPIDTVNKELSRPEDNINSNTLNSPHRELQILYEQCNQYGLYYFFSPLENNCVIACTASKDLEYHPNKQNDYFYEQIRMFSIQYEEYSQIPVRDGLKCSDNGYCQSGKCLKKTTSGVSSLLSKDALIELANNECQKIGTLGAFNISSIDCALNCMEINIYSRSFTINQKLAPNGFPCSNNGICNEGTCLRIF
ncbi:uncharacterized protein LOC122503677 [Leptopilina heterotoma]|uniref:uncharacterized protein LOC122503677 n=1 Tax=Leptopilina heterotoma TaxID=63436 RepID=UPI001CA8D27A|nr:uncharacterized protein LOC122503677 [Leptopilina heterotoma]